MAWVQTARRWTPDEEQTLRKMFEDGKHDYDIGLALDRSMEAVTMRRNHLGIRRPVGRPAKALTVPDNTCTKCQRAVYSTDGALRYCSNCGYEPPDSAVQPLDVPYEPPDRDEIDPSFRHPGLDSLAAREFDRTVQPIPARKPGASSSVAVSAAEPPDSSSGDREEAPMSEIEVMARTRLQQVIEERSGYELKLEELTEEANTLNRVIAACAPRPGVKCPKCEKAFSDAPHRKAHMRQAHGEAA